MKKPRIALKKPIDLIIPYVTPTIAPIYFSQRGYDNQLKRMKELEKQMAQLSSVTRDALENEGGSQEDSSILGNINETLMGPTNLYNQLKKELGNFKIIQYPISVDSVCIGCNVKININGERNSFYIVGYGENGTYQTNKSIRYDTPIAKAIMGQKPGYKGNFDTPDRRFKVIEVLSVGPIKEQIKED